MTVFTIDVSQWDVDRLAGRDFNWPAVLAGGLAAVCVRATYGDPQVYAPTTRHFRALTAGAGAAGCRLVGGYHNLIHGDAASIRRQVDYFWSELSAAGCTWAMLDVEPYQALRANGLWPRWIDVLAFRDAWRHRTSMPLVFYLARWVWNGWLGAPNLAELGGPLVNAAYPKAEAMAPPGPLYSAVGGDDGGGWAPYGGVVPDGWQFSAKGVVSGASHWTDVNAWRTDETGLAALLTGGSMPDWFVNRALTNFRNAVNAKYPRRDTGTDGTKGDRAHAATTSDHNPDPDGSVDAWDMDVDLNGVGQPYAADVEALKRVFQAHESAQYWIHNDVICSRKDGWKRRSYAYAGPGRNRHGKHVHWNTRQSHENSNAPWILDGGGGSGEEATMTMTSNQQDTLYFTTVSAPNGPSHVRDALIMQELQATRAELAALAGRPEPPATAILTDGQLKQLAELLAAADNNLPGDPATIETAVRSALDEWGATVVKEGVQAALREGTDG